MTATGSWEVVRERKRRRIGAGVDTRAFVVWSAVAARVGTSCVLTTTAVAWAADASQEPTFAATIPVNARARDAEAVRSRRMVIGDTPAVCAGDG
jgi:hypothetical protein